MFSCRGLSPFRLVLLNVRYLMLVYTPTIGRPCRLQHVVRPQLGEPPPLPRRLPAGTMFRRDHAGRVAEHLIAALQLRRRRSPACSHPSLEQFGRRGPSSPDGDRRHGAQSGRVVREVEPVIAGSDA